MCSPEEQAAPCEVPSFSLRGAQAEPWCSGGCVQSHEAALFQDSSCSFACFPADCYRKDAFGWELLDFGSRCCSGSNPRPELVLRGSLRHPRPGAPGSAQTTYRHRTNAALSWVLGSASPSCSGTRCRGHCPDEKTSACAGSWGEQGSTTQTHALGASKVRTLRFAEPLSLPKHTHLSVD